MLAGTARMFAGFTLLWLITIALLLALQVKAQPNGALPTPSELYVDSACAGCHGPNMMGGLGPPLAETKLTYEQFLKTVREGRGMMPATPASKTSDEELRAVYNLAQQTRLDIAQVPLSYKVGQWLTTTRVAVIFTIITLVALVFTIRVILYWVDCAGWKYFKPYVRRFGYGRALGVFFAH